ncbi:diguanylate cyclase [Halomonas sp. TRM85114]|uniref:sensor domain-containing diguanylate cyclase n=1 Tax=Halomonas jincaotanensis TaxID=2810616 RepID=UPI001BD5E356|nr:sensor domain-containing diguanylate cyclase [Halomonas jincaotanensis]MBS9403416.1 diguanylate cyclase [Halomonas jincaotanensis]
MPTASPSIRGPVSATQPSGCVLILDADASRVLQTSANLPEILGVSVDAALAEGPGRLLGHDLARRLRRELQGRQRLPGALSIKRRVAGGLRSLQLDARRSGDRVLVEIEPLIRQGKRRLLATLNAWLMRLAAADHPDELLDSLVAGVADLTGHDRVLVCGFDANGHGAVVAERCAPGVPSFIGMRFPASDFPPHMRERSDVRAAAVPLIPALDPCRQTRADLSTSLLRSISPEQQRYLTGMGVASLLSIGMHGDGGLWGLVLCHGMAPHALSPAVRDAALGLVQMATQRLFLLRARSEARFLQRVQESRALLDAELSVPDTLLRRHGDNWLELFSAQGLVLVMPEGNGQLGQVPRTASLALLVERLETTHHRPGPWVSQALGHEPLTSDLALDGACGLLAVAFSLGEWRRGWLLLFRPEQRETYAWVGLPDSGLEAACPGEALPDEQNLLGRLFSQWQEEISGHSAAWERIERLAARDLAEQLAVVASAQEINRLYCSLRQEQQALAEANRRLEHLAHHDALTRVWNRYRIEQAMDAELTAAERCSRPMAVLLFDIDHFKRINDDHDHEMGDRVLTMLAREVESTLRGCDYLGRWGGEEFVVLATSSDLDAGLGLAERLKQRIGAMAIPGLPCRITASFGVAAWRRDDTRKSLLSRADDAMYRAKEAGRDRLEAQG